MGTTGQSITLANSIIGVGILAMPFCFQQCGILLATLILLSMGLVSRLCCHFLLKSALLARRRNFEFLAGKMAVELGIIGFLMGTCIAYFVVVGDLGPQIIAKIFNINQSDILRTSIMVIVSLVCVLPLGLLRNVDSLSNVSAATIGFYFCLVIKVVMDATSQLFTEDWSTRMEMWKPQGVLQCVPIFSMALFCQTQLFEIFESMQALSLEKMNVVTKNAINICTVVYFTLGLFGYIAFSKHEISGNILMSLSPTMTSDVIKLGFVMSLAFSFPLIIFPCRASLYSFLYKKVHPSQHDHIINHSIPEGSFRCITVAIIATALVVSLLLPNIELVLGLLGATVGVLVCIMFPAACFVSVTFKNTNERVLAKVILVLGLVIMVLGTYANLQAAENTHDKYDDKYITQERIDKMVEDFFQSKKLEEEGVVIKPPETVELVPKEIIKNGKEAVVDSEVQPPNPIPPESQPIEKNDPPPLSLKKGLKRREEKKLKEEQKDPQQVVDKVSETHPKNLYKNPDAKPSGEIKKEDKIETPTKDNIKEMSNQQKIDLIKQAHLMETIKEHGEEQKALIKEQKEILHNILKTKQELQQNNNEAKKIAVESIQKIASMAIQSLSAVSEQPVEKINDPGDNANEAVKKIADVAVEAIKELKEKPMAPAPLINSDHLVADAVPGQNVNNKVNQNAQKAQNPNPPVQSVNNASPVQPKVDVVKSDVKIDKGDNDSEQFKNVQPDAQISSVVQKPIQNLESNKIDDNLIAERIKHNNEAQEKPQLSADHNKEHLHLSDEPQSYKQGEEAQKSPKLNTNILNNVPIPIAMNENSFKTAEVEHEVVENPEIHVLNGAEQPNNKQDISVPNRQKREVIDCTNQASLRVQDKEICKSLVNSKKDSEEILPKVDLNKVLPKGLPFVDLNMVHHMRSLKSYNEEKRR